MRELVETDAVFALMTSAALLVGGAGEVRKGSPARLHPAARKRLWWHLETCRRDVRFPGKAVRFLDWWLHQEAKRDGRTRVLYPRDVSAAYARFSGLPLDLIADEIPSGAAEIAAKLSAVVVGQGEACATAARVLARFKAGLNDPERPIGALLFVGPTGVGKTELAKELARTMFGDPKRMIRIDMSELMLPGASARLLDASPGGASLAQRVRQEPLSLVLLDEI